MRSPPRAGATASRLHLLRSVISPHHPHGHRSRPATASPATPFDSPSSPIAADNDYQDGTALPTYGVCFDSTWGRHKWRVRPAAGDDDSLVGYFSYFGVAAHGPKGYYSYDFGTWHVIVLNSAVAVDSTQAQWLRADLAAHPALCTVAISHRPSFSSGNSGNSPGQLPYFQALDEAGAELILDGNDHDYERFAGQQADQTPDPDGLVEIVVGTGGKSHGRINLPLAANNLV